MAMRYLELKSKSIRDSANVGRTETKGTKDSR